MSKQSTPVERIAAIVLTAALCTSTYLAWRAGAYWALVVLVPLALLSISAVVDSLRQGVRQPTAFERFEEQQLKRLVPVVLAGGVLALQYWAGYGGGLVLPSVIVLLAAIFIASRLRGRHETSAGYKRRVGYRDPEERRKGDTNDER
jgi:hypothetical protein